MRIKHTTKISDITILVNAQIMEGNAFVASSSSLSPIQSQIIGKHVFNFIQLQVPPQLAAITWVHHNHPKPNNTAKTHPNKYDNILFFIKLGIKK